MKKQLLGAQQRCKEGCSKKQARKARADQLNRSENKVNGPEDATVSEMMKRLSLGKIYAITRCFQERFMGQMDVPSSWKIVKLVVSRRPDAAPKKGIRSDTAMVLTSVMSKWYVSCLEKEQESESWKKVHVGEIDGISCPHLQVMMTFLLQKHLEWQEDRTTRLRHGSVVRPTVYLQAWTPRQPSMRRCQGISQRL